MQANELKSGVYFIGIAASFWDGKQQRATRESHTGCVRHYLAVPADRCTVVAQFPTAEYYSEAGLFLEVLAGLPPGDPMALTPPRGTCGSSAW
jgi:hypothetical protein